MSAARRLVLASDADPVVGASAWVRALGDELELTQADLFRLDLCITEVVSNVVEHAYHDTESHRIELDADATSDAVRIRVSDDGIAFDPLDAPAPLTAPTLDGKAIGGWGLRLLRAFSDSVAYQRVGCHNQLDFVIRLGARVARGTERRVPSASAAFPLQPPNGEPLERERRHGQDRRVRGFISDFQLFHGVPYAQVEDVVRGCEVLEFEEGEILLRPGQENRHVALIIRGRLRVHLDAPDSSDFVEVGAGDCVGEMSVIDNSPVSAYVVADASCRMLLIDTDTFLTRVLPIPRVARNLISMLNARTRRTNRRTIERIKTSMELERIRRELGVAREIQAGMLPQGSPLFPERPELDCAARMRAAGEVGGDFYDAFFIDPSHVLLLIGDVCGKGIPAALLMVRALTLVRNEAMRRHRSQRDFLQRVMDRVNDQLFEGSDGKMFVTLFCGILDTASGALTYVNAGHNAPLLSLAPPDFDYLAEPRNLVAGAAPGTRYRAGEVGLPAGATVVLYTDGVPEAECRSGAAFGEERLRAAVRDAPAGSAAHLVEHLFASVDGFVGGHAQSDDITVLVLRYWPAAPGNAS
jgi:anti-sigma regulatory factor (Ser/Thr protein kinase)/CRP-like cAMP-binding protein